MYCVASPQRAHALAPSEPLLSWAALQPLMPQPLVNFGVLM